MDHSDAPRRLLLWEKGHVGQFSTEIMPLPGSLLHGNLQTGLRFLKQENASFAIQNIANQIAVDASAMIDWIVYDAYPDVPKGISSTFPNNKVTFRFDDMVAMVGAAQAGLGVVRMPMFLGRASAGLVQVPVLPPQPYAGIWVVGHPDVWPSRKLRAFRDILVSYCKNTAVSS